jgi:transcriptional regulator with XRE-family HTH domain
MGTRDERVGSNVKHIRDQLGMSQAEVAEGMTEDGCPGFYPQTILKVEKGTRSLKLTEADSLARVLNVQLSALLDPGTPDAVERLEVATAQRRADALGKEAEIARETARHAEREAQDAKNAAAEALLKLEASQRASREADAAADKASMVVMIDGIKKRLNSRGGK